MKRISENVKMLTREKKKIILDLDKVVTGYEYMGRLLLSGHSRDGRVEGKKLTALLDNYFVLDSA